MVADGQTSGAALEHLARVDPGSNDWERELSAATMGLVDTILKADASALQQLTDPLRDRLAELFEDSGHTREIRGWLLALLSITRLALQRLPSQEELEFPRSGQAWTFLKALEQHPRKSAYVRQHLDTGDSQVSRVGRDLLARGLVIQRRLGREATWELTPRGRQLLRAAHDATDASARLALPAGGRGSRTTQRAGDAAPARKPSTAGRTGRAARAAAPKASNGQKAARDATQSPRVEAADTGSRPRATGVRRAAAGLDRNVRHVMPNPHGGWRIAKDPAGRTIRSADTKEEALRQARTIVARAGGGKVTPYSREGEAQRPITVEPGGD